MQKNTRSLLAFLSLLLLGVAPCFAQVPTDSLKGKTIHLYVESDDFNAFYFQNGDLPFTSPSKYHYTITLADHDNAYIQDFFFTSNGNAPAAEHFKWKFGKAGINDAESRIKVSEFEGKDTMWVIVDPAGPATAPPKIMLEAPKVINILNPWTTTAPVLVHGGTKIRKMTTTPGRCGWFTTLILDPTIVSGHFAEVNRTDTYGLAGPGSNADFDFTALFGTHGKSIWLNTEAGTWTPAWPNVNGDCQYLMAATVRDFSMNHPDFDYPGTSAGDTVQKGMVQPALGADLKPKRTTKASINAITFGEFDKWWSTDSLNATPALRNYESCVDIPMSKASDGLWEYDSYRDSPLDHGFFPIEGTEHNRHGDVLPNSCYSKPPPEQSQWVMNGPKRNGNFCMESHATFIYQPGQTFSFRGDDDVWVFIDNKLVVDLGGVHTPRSDSVNLSALNLTPGKEYSWDFFYCDREDCGSSLRVKTSIFFKQQRALFGKELPGPTPGSTKLEIWKLEGGKGSCASVGSTTEPTLATNLKYQVLNASGTVVKELETGGEFYGGAIKIATSTVTIDTSLKAATWETLTPGSVYRVVAFEPSKPLLKVEVPFRVPVRSFVQIVSPAVDTEAKAGELIQVIFGAFDNGVPSALPVKYVPSPELGLLLYSDVNRTPAELGNLTTNETGFDTLWVTAMPTADKAFKLALPLPGNTRSFTFTVPKNRVEFHPWSPAVEKQSVPVLTQVVINLANLEAGAVQPKAETYKLEFTKGLQVFTDAAMTPASAVTSGTTELTTELTGLDVIYATADSTDPKTKDYTIKVIGPTATTKVITLTFTMPALDLPKPVSAKMYDADGDGHGDSLVVEYDRDITAMPPTRIGYSWPAGSALVPVPVAGTPAAQGIIAGKILTYKTKFSPAVLTNVTGEFTSFYTARGEEFKQTVPIADGIGPIILTAKITVGTTHDTLRLTFSEQVNTGGITVGKEDVFGYRRTSEGEIVAIAPASLTWSIDRKEAVLVFLDAPDAPRTGNQIRINDGAGRIADAAGNPAGPRSKFKSITGDMRSNVKRKTLHRIAPQPPLLAEPSLTVSLQDTEDSVPVVIAKTGRIGHLIETDLGNYAVKDDFGSVDPSKVVLEYHVGYFTNHGETMVTEKRSFSCTDKKVYPVDCLTNRKHIFVGWNYTAKNGSRAGTGAYVVHFSYNVKVAGEVKERGGANETWGIIRER